jgi:hypothetical protein
MSVMSQSGFSYLGRNGSVGWGRPAFLAKLSRVLARASTECVLMSVLRSASSSSVLMQRANSR